MAHLLERAGKVDGDAGRVGGVEARRTLSAAWRTAGWVRIGAGVAPAWLRPKVGIGSRRIGRIAGFAGRLCGCFARCGDVQIEVRTELMEARC